jgi:membrane associated rhomboid family serine protease
MLIIGTNTSHEGKFPNVTCSLIAINVVVFAIQLIAGDSINYGFSLVPQEITTGKDLTTPQTLKYKIPVTDYDRQAGRWVEREEEVSVPVPQHPGPVPIYLTLFTSMFMHTGVIHLIGNMWFLFVFGAHVERRMGDWLYLVFYLFCGVVAGLAHVASGPNSFIPCMGASGAISGVMAAYISLYPLSMVKLWMGWYIGVVDAPALLMLGIWFGLQYLNAVVFTSGAAYGGVAYWAHIGGFLAGFAFIWALILVLQARAAIAPAPPPEEEPGDEAKEPTAEANGEQAATDERHPVASDPYADFLSGLKQPSPPEKSYR